MEQKVGEWSFCKGKSNSIYGLGVKDFFGPEHLYLSVLHTGDKLVDSLKCWLFYNNSNNNLNFPSCWEDAVFL